MEADVAFGTVGDGFVDEDTVDGCGDAAALEGDYRLILFAVSKFAEFAGINESKMRAYKCGVVYPGEKTTRKIMQAIDRIGQDLRATIL